MNFPVFSQLAGNFRVSETGSLQTASSSGESIKPYALASAYWPVSLFTMARTAESCRPDWVWELRPV